MRPYSCKAAGERGDSVVPCVRVLGMDSLTVITVPSSGWQAASSCLPSGVIAPSTPGLDRAHLCAFQPALGPGQRVGHGTFQVLIVGPSFLLTCVLPAPRPPPPPLPHPQRPLRSFPKAELEK